MSASIGVKRPNRVRPDASFMNSDLVILPSLVFETARRKITSTRSISIIIFWKARTLA
jgi:hypothetical protein